MEREREREGVKRGRETKKGAHSPASDESGRRGNILKGWRASQSEKTELKEKLNEKRKNPRCTSVSFENSVIPKLLWTGSFLLHCTRLFVRPVALFFISGPDVPRSVFVLVVPFD